MTQRKLTSKELEAARRAYQGLGELYGLPDSSMAVDMCVWLALRIEHKTTDGKPLALVGRVPTAADIGRRVKVRDDESNQWSHNYRFVGLAASSRFVAQHDLSGIITGWQYCIIDQEAGQ
jgi:hypothetical protein